MCIMNATRGASYGDNVSDTSECVVVSLVPGSV